MGFIFLQDLFPCLQVPQVLLQCGVLASVLDPLLSHERHADPPALPQQVLPQSLEVG